MSSPWPFSVWGLDIIGEIHPTASNGHMYILVAIDYFTKWVEAESYSKLGAKQVTKFLERNLFWRYEIPHHLISDNRVQFQGEVWAMLERYKIKHYKSLSYRPQANRVVEVANKNIKKIHSKMIETHCDWANKLPFALWGYHTTVRTSTGETPFSLLYRTEAVLLIEVEIKFLRVIVKAD